MRRLFDGKAPPHGIVFSYNIPTNAAAMLELDANGEIEIAAQDGAHIVAKLTLKGRALLDHSRVDEEGKRHAASSTNDHARRAALAPPADTSQAA